MTGVGPSGDAIYASCPTYPSLGMDVRVPYQVLPSRVNRLLSDSLTLSESVSENGSKDYGSSGSGDVGRLELNGSPSSNEPKYVAIRAPPGLTQDIGEVANVYPVVLLASLGLPFLPSPSGFANEKITPPPPQALLRAPSAASAASRATRELQFCRHLPRLRPGEACRLRACPSLNRPQWRQHEENLQNWGRRTRSWSREWLEGSQVTPWQLRK